MYCPQCGSIQSDDLKFCKSCGSNLQIVRQFMVSGENAGKFDWSKTWVAEMFLSEGEQIKRRAELERLRGITPDVKRVNEVRAGVITSSVGLGTAIFLYVFMEGIIRGAGITPGAAEILGRIWIAGIIPFFIGLGLIFNGLFVGNKLLKSKAKEASPASLPETDFRALRSAETTEFTPPELSVTDGTTRHLSPGQR